MGKDRDTAAADNSSAPPENWKVIGSSGALHRRFEFDDYAATSAFLDRLAKLSEETGLYPDLSFATTYVSVTVPADDAASDPGLQMSFATKSIQIFEGGAA